MVEVEKKQLLASCGTQLRNTLIDQMIWGPNSSDEQEEESDVFV